MDIIDISLCPVTFTDVACAEIVHIYNHKNIPANYGLRIAVEGGGCAAVSFIIGFDKRKEADKVYGMDNIHVFIEKRHLMFLFGVTVDFLSNEHEQGFKFVK